MMSVHSKKKLKIAGGLLLAAFAGYLSFFLSQEYEGQIVIYNKKDANNTYPSINCTLPFITSEVNFQNNSEGCVNDDAYAFKLEEVPSATFFTFTDAPDCSDSGGFYYRFKTIQHPTTMTEPMDIGTAGQKAVDSVVTPGVLLVASKTTGQVGGKLSCVKIERSAVPKP
ncbi:hypothetical protein N018_09705 [Pseudomonas syringae CC1557]|uniref:Lipoprotein n=1 Tax=Pseudomonas syringae CC1557 TaxID=1357279 RepID=W0N2N2_PSESX|nr:hypothetical protein [Pseudomonas syringae]AHG43538.1 hypothetical protein N018_09705 [Pseudomonas syringae CC1557]